MGVRLPYRSVDAHRSFPPPSLSVVVSWGERWWGVDDGDVRGRWSQGEKEREREKKRGRKRWRDNREIN